MMKKAKLVSIILIFTTLLTLLIVFRTPISQFIRYSIKYYISFKGVKVPEEYSKSDKNNNGIPDPIDLVNEAMKEVKNKTPYKSQYYNGGYPPDSEGVCTDVIWRAFKGINVNLKDLVDKDINANLSSYPRVQKKPDPNIDFRRVPNMDVFFKRNALTLTTEIIPGDVNSLKQWQPGDIIVILKPYEHIAIVSNKRTKDGVPYVIHNTHPNATESTHFNLWNVEIAGHYRWKFSN